MDLRAAFVAFFLVFAVVVSTKSAEIPASNVVMRHRRSETTEEKKICSDMAHCKWAIYGNDPTKKIRYNYETDNCVCGEGRKCSFSEENLRRGMYIYRCTVEVNIETTEAIVV